jgi:hypothetical protein
MDIPAATGSAPRVSLLSASLRDHEHGHVPARFPGGHMDDPDGSPHAAGGFSEVSMSLGRSPFFHAPQRGTGSVRTSSCSTQLQQQARGALTTRRYAGYDGLKLHSRALLLCRLAAAPQAPPG